VSQRRQYLLFFALVVGVVAAAFVLGRPRKDAGLLAAVPRDAWLVVDVDVASLRGSALAQPLLGAGDKMPIPGLGSLATTCGFDPVARLREVLVTSPESGERGEFAVAFTGDFTLPEIEACAKKVIASRGGTPSTTARAGYTLVEDANDAQHARLAYREGGPYLVGKGAWLDATIDAVLGKGEPANALHAELRSTLAALPAPTESGAPPRAAASRAITVTALLPASVRDKLKGELSPELAAAGEKTFAGVLGVSALGLAVGTGGPGSTTDLTVEMRCESASACDEVDKLLERKRAAFVRDMGVRFLGLGPLLDSLALNEKGATLSATASASTDDLAHALQRVIDLKGLLSHSPSPTPAPAPTPTSAPAPTLTPAPAPTLAPTHALTPSP
jgi:hypothetical protein